MRVTSHWNEQGYSIVEALIACSLTMMAANEHLIKPILLATPVPELQFRISIDYGNVTVARLGAARRFTLNPAVERVQQSMGAGT